MITRFSLPKHGQETPGWITLKIKKQKIEKPTIKDLHDLSEGAIENDHAVLLLEQIEELCLIIIDYYANGQ